jgi:hypothetical protein
MENQNIGAVLVQVQRDEGVLFPWLPLTEAIASGKHAGH